jgi:hypothetical protein
MVRKAYFCKKKVGYGGRSNPAAAPSTLDEDEDAQRRILFPGKESGGEARSSHHLHQRELPQYRGVLESRDGHLHDPR